MDYKVNDVSTVRMISMDSNNLEKEKEKREKKNHKINPIHIKSTLIEKQLSLSKKIFLTKNRVVFYILSSTRFLNTLNDFSLFSPLSVLQTLLCRRSQNYRIHFIFLRK